MTGQYLSISETAKLTGYSHQTICHKLVAGEIEGALPREQAEAQSQDGRIRRIPRDWAEAHKKPECETSLKGIYRGRIMDTTEAELVVRKDYESVAEWHMYDDNGEKRWNKSSHHYINRIYKDFRGYFLVTDDAINRERVFREAVNFFGVPARLTGEGQAAVLYPVTKAFAEWAATAPVLDCDAYSERFSDD